MNKVLSVFLLVFLMAPALSANEVPSSLKKSTIEQMGKYAQALYERNDYSQAAQVFSRILKLDPNNSNALAYIGKIKNPKASNAPCCFTNPVVIKPLRQDPNADLKQELNAENRAISSLKAELAQLRTQTEMVSNE